MASPTHEQAQLQLKLYDLRRETRLRQARDWYWQKYWADTLDEAMREVSVAGRVVTLSPREFSLLECFLRHPGQALSRDQLLDAAWPYGVAVTPNTVDAYVHLLREKLGPVGSARIRTERGVGYRLLARERTSRPERREGSGVEVRP